MSTESGVVPLRKWRLKNFKSARDVAVDFRPLTLLVGANSSGKSTVLQSILLVAQAAQSGAANGAFSLNGQLAGLGTYDDTHTLGSRGHTAIGGELSLHPQAVPGSGEMDLPWLLDWPARRLLDSARSPRDPRRRAGIAFDAGFAVAGRNSSGAAQLRSLKLALQGGVPGDEQAYALRLTRQSDEPSRAYFWQAPPKHLERIGSTDIDLAEYSGSAARVRPKPRRERIGAASFVGIFPTRMAAARPAIRTAVEHWIAYALAGRQDVHFDDDEMLDGAPWRPTGADDAAGEISSCLIRTLEHLRSSVAEAGDWPCHLMHSLVKSEEYARGDRAALAEREPIGKILLALAFAEHVSLEEALAGDPYDLYPSSDPPWEWTSPDPVETAWHELGRACLVALREHGDSIAASVDEHFGLSAMLNVEPGEDARLLTRASTAAAEFFREKLFYLGPLREDPHPVSQRSLVPGSSALGAKGEFTAAVVLEHAHDEVVAPCLDGCGDEPRRVPLRDAIEEWLRFFEIGVALELQENPFGPVLRIKDREGGHWLNLTHVGVGVSQLLPVIVLCLIAPPDSVIVLEQPELHLHPALQQRLGDFLLACARSGRQLIVETHSEHIVARLRRRIAAAPDDSLVSTVEILFAEKNDGGDTQFRPVRANEYGGIEEWPRGFFDQSTSEAQEIVRAAVRKRRAEADSQSAEGEQPRTPDS
jgi:predicted ATPase